MANGAPDHSFVNNGASINTMANSVPEMTIEFFEDVLTSRFSGDVHLSSIFKFIVMNKKSSNKGKYYVKLILELTLWIPDQCDGRPSIGSSKVLPAIESSILRIAAGQLGKRMGMMVLPLELLQQFRSSDFLSQVEYEAWQEKIVKILEVGLLVHPHFPLDKTDTSARHFKQIIQGAFDKPIDTGKYSESMKALRNVVTSLALSYLKLDHKLRGEKKTLMLAKYIDLEQVDGRYTFDALLGVLVMFIFDPGGVLVAQSLIKGVVNMYISSFEIAVPMLVSFKFEGQVVCPMADFACLNMVHINLFPLVRVPFTTGVKEKVMTNLFKLFEKQTNAKSLAMSFSANLGLSKESGGNLNMGSVDLYAMNEIFFKKAEELHKLQHLDMSKNSSLGMLPSLIGNNSPGLLHIFPMVMFTCCLLI